MSPLRISLHLCVLILVGWVTCSVSLVHAGTDKLQLPTQPHTPAILSGIILEEQKPITFRFVLAHGDGQRQADVTEVERLVEYFLTGLTIPEEDLWVNLSPYEHERVIAPKLGLTRLGRDFLQQDYSLKKLSASLLHPDTATGGRFWAEVYRLCQKHYDTVDIPLDTFNKIWIVPERADVYQTSRGAFITDSHLGVMLESDYQARYQGLIHVDTGGSHSRGKTAERRVTDQVFRKQILPLIEREVNEGAAFTRLRQIYHSLILAKWYKEHIGTSLVRQVFVDREKLSGFDILEGSVREEVYERYINIYQKGLYDVIREDSDPVSGGVLPRRYFSGGSRMIIPLTLSATREDYRHRFSAGRYSVVQITGIPNYTDYAVLADKAAFGSPELYRAWRQIRNRGNYGFEEFQQFFERMPANSSQLLSDEFGQLSGTERRDHLYSFIVGDQDRITATGRHLFFNPAIVTGPQIMQDRLSAAIDFLERQKEEGGQLSLESPAAEIYAVLESYGISFGWGNRLERILDNLNDLKILLSNEDVGGVEAAYDRFLLTLPLVRGVVLQTPHGFFNQEFEMGAPDTGGQVVYLTEYARELAAQLRRTVENSGIPEADQILPQVLIVTRLIPKNPFDAVTWSKLRSDVPVEQLNNYYGEAMDNAWILRVPFKTPDGNVLPEFIERAEVWPYISQYARDSIATVDNFLRERQPGVKPRVDIVIGNYSDGSTASAIEARSRELPLLRIPHAFERSKARRINGDGVVNYIPAVAHFDIFSLADAYLTDIAYEVLSSPKEIRIQMPAVLEGVVENTEQWDLFGRFGSVKFDVVPTGVSSEVINHDRPAEIPRFLEYLRGETEAFKTMVTSLNRIAEGASNPIKKVKIVRLLKQMYAVNRDPFIGKTIASGAAYDEIFTRSAQIIRNLYEIAPDFFTPAITDFVNQSGRPAADFDKFLEQLAAGEVMQLSFSEKVGDPLLFYSMARLAKEKNLIALVRAFNGTAGLRSYLSDVLVQRPQPFVNEEFLARLREGALPQELLEEPFLAFLRQYDTNLTRVDQLTEIRELRENSIALIVAGPQRLEEASDSERLLYNQIMDVVQKSGLQDIIVRLPGMPAPSLFPLAHRMRGIYVQPAIEEPYGLTIKEGASNGITLMTRNAGASAEYEINDELAAFIFDPESEEDLPALMLGLIRSEPERRDRLARTFMEHSRSYGSWSNKAGKTLAFALKLNVKYSSPEEREKLMRHYRQAGDLFLPEMERVISEEFAVDGAVLGANLPDSNPAASRDVGGIDVRDIRLNLSGKGPSAGETKISSEMIDYMRSHMHGLTYQIEDIVTVGPQDNLF